MIRLLFRQPRHLWRTLGWLHQLELILLLGILYTYLITRLHPIMVKWMAQDNVTATGLGSLCGHLFLFVILFSTPFILAYALPRQKGLQVFRTLPLNRRQYFQITGYYFLKFQSINLLLFLPVCISIFPASSGAALSALLITVAGGFCGFVLLNILRLRFRGNGRYTVLSLVLCTAGLFVFVTGYWILGWPWLFDIVLITVVLLTLYITRKDVPPALEQIYPETQAVYRIQNKTSFSFRRLPKFLPAGLQVLFNKELLSLWRNPHYRRLKWMTVLIFIVLSSLISISIPENRLEWLVVLTAAVIWIHYSNHFNEKYVMAEPAWYFRSLPFRFHQLWLSKFLVEFVFVFQLLIINALFLLAVSGTPGTIWPMSTALFFFALIILVTMLNFQMIFFDEPRLAGYAYHFTIIFLTVMTINYHLVGPLISLFMMGFYFYKSYSGFKS